MGLELDSAGRRRLSWLICVEICAWDEARNERGLFFAPLAARSSIRRADVCGCVFVPTIHGAPCKWLVVLFSFLFKGVSDFDTI